MPKFYMIFASKKINKIPEFYMTFDKKYFPEIWEVRGRAALPRPPAYAYAGRRRKIFRERRPRWLYISGLAQF